MYKNLTDIYDAGASPELKSQRTFPPLGSYRDSPKPGASSGRNLTIECPLFRFLIILDLTDYTYPRLALRDLHCVVLDMDWMDGAKLIIGCLIARIRESEPAASYAKEKKQRFRPKRLLSLR